MCTLNTVEKSVYVRHTILEKVIKKRKDLYAQSVRLQSTKQIYDISGNTRYVHI